MVFSRRLGSFSHCLLSNERCNKLGKVHMMVFSRQLGSLSYCLLFNESYNKLGKGRRRESTSNSSFLSRISTYANNRSEICLYHPDIQNHGAKNHNVVHVRLCCVYFQVKCLLYFLLYT